MSLKDLKHLKAWFADYVAGFYTDDPANNRTVRLKGKHTKRVCENIIMLGNALGLSDQEMILEETMGLFHDTGLPDDAACSPQIVAAIRERRLARIED